MEKIFQISDNIHGLISCSRLEKELISSVPFNRLHYVLQNSTAFKTFPSNQTSRLSHSLGAMHISGKMILSCIMNADSEVVNCLLSNIKKEIHTIVKNNESELRAHGVAHILHKFSRSENLKDISIHLPDEFYKSMYFPVNNEGERFALLLLTQAVRCSALFHDIGHPPFSHIVEFALNDLYKDLNEIDNGKLTKRSEDFLRILNYYKKDNADAELHEEIGIKLTDRVLEDVFKSRAHLGENEVLFSFLVWHLTKNILQAKSISEIKGVAYEDSGFYSDIHEIISGHMDCDRLDYIVRDVSNSGFTKGIIEYDRLIYSSKLQYREYSSELSEKRFIISYDIRCLNTVEDFFRRRWCLYKELIYHHRVRKTDALLQKLVYKISTEYLQDSTNTEEFDGDGALTMDISGLWKALDVFFSTEDLFNSTIQWKDNWLISSLEQYYFDNRDGNNIIHGMLNEFLKNQKVYYSRIKRGIDFDIFDKNLRSQLLKIGSEKLDVIKKGNNLAHDEFFFKQVIVPFFQINKSTLKKHNINIDTILFKSVEGAIKKLEITDYLLIVNKSKNAEKFRVYFHNMEECDLLEKQSFLQKELMISEISYPYFYLFTTDYNNRDTNSNEMILKEVSKALVDNLKSVIEIIVKEEEAMKQKMFD